MSTGYALEIYRHNNHWKAQVCHNVGMCLDSTHHIAVRKYNGTHYKVTRVIILHVTNAIQYNICCVSIQYDTFMSQRPSSILILPMHWSWICQSGPSHHWVHTHIRHNPASQGTNMLDFRKSSLSLKQQAHKVFQNEKKCRKNGNTELACFDFRTVKEEELVSTPSASSRPPSTSISTHTETSSSTHTETSQTWKRKHENSRKMDKLLFYLCISFWYTLS